MLTPVTTVKSGRLPDWVQPVRTPAANAPSAPPPDMASHGPFEGGSTLRKSVAVSPQTRAFSKPGMAAAAWSSGVKGVRGGSPFFVTACGAGAGFTLGLAFGRGLGFGLGWLCAKAVPSLAEITVVGGGATATAAKTRPS